MTTRPRPLLVISLAAVIWSTSFAVTKVLLDTVPPLTIGALRFTAAALLLAVLVRRQPGWRPDEGSLRRRMAMCGLLGITAYFTLENVGVELATAGDAALIVASYPLITLLLAVSLRQASLDARTTAGMLLALPGVWLIVRGSAGEGGEDRLLGDLLLLLGGVVWAVYNLTARAVSAQRSALTVTYYQTCAGAAGFLVLAPFEHQGWRPLTMGDVLLLVYLAGFCSVLAFLLYNTGLRDVTPAVAVNLLNLVPVFGIASAVVVAGERLTGSQVAGGLVVIVAVALGSGRSPSSPAAPAPSPATPDHTKQRA